MVAGDCDANTMRAVQRGALDRTIRVWDLTLHEPLCQAELRGHRGGVTGLAVSTSKLVSGSADMTLKMFILA